MTSEEHWKFIRGTLRRYSVSNYGNVRRNAYRVRGALGVVRWYEEAPLYPAVRKDDRKGLWCKLRVHGRVRQINVGRCVADHWLYAPIRKKELVWLDGNHENNHLSNLAWRVHEPTRQLHTK